jgi:four helix bundle protein
MNGSLKSFDVFELSKKLVVACYALTASLPPEEKTSLTQYIRNAALSTHINILQCTFLKKKKKHKKYIRAAKNSLVVIDAAVDVLIEVKLVTEPQTSEVMQLSSTVYQVLDRLKKDK